MTTQHIDATLETEKDSMSTATGATLTNDVRIVYDDTMPTSELYTLITRIRDKILEVEE